MEEIKLKPKYTFNVPINAKCVTPDAFAGKSLNEIKELTVREGNREQTLDTLFNVEGKVGPSPTDVKIVIDGSSMLRWIGYKMTNGSVEVLGDVGHYVGNNMLGGTITIRGHAGARLGSKMKGGIIEVFGNAGPHVGSYYRGEKPGKGMKGGTVIIHGNAGAELGAGMKGGTIVVDGNVGYLAGVDMRGGTIGIKGDSDGKIGARMQGGKIVLMGRLPHVLPSFYIDAIAEKAKVGADRWMGPFYVFIGDVLASIKCGGRLYVSMGSNTHLKPYETFLE
jgi:formylmethanofuran dehydrogenase subunit C